jgi:dipeptidase D
MGKEIIRLSPSILWKHFYAFTQIPRPSTKETKVIKYIQEFASKNGLVYTIDEVGNILVTKPAVAGKENLPGVILQSHVDMVPQKNSVKKHNFETDAIETIIDGEWVKANQTTLGADNGIGCAAMLAVLEDSSIAHGPIEALFTINEEAGMIGAFGLKGNLLKGKILINLDSEVEGQLTVGCAGALNLEAAITYEQEEVSSGESLEIIFSGLKGGHSGVDIALGRANSNKLMGRFLWSVLADFPIQISTIKGGDLRNAIPRESHAIITIPKQNKNAFLSYVKHFTQTITEEYRYADSDISIKVQPADRPKMAIASSVVNKFIGMLNAAPNGVVRMSDTMPKVVETSLNLAIIDFNNGKALFLYLLRSFNESAKYALGEQVTAFHKILDCDVVYAGDYPGWRPDLQSKIVKVCTKVYQTELNKKPEVLAMHAGLECGIIGSKYTDLEMISFGPTIRFPHSPDEKVHVQSVERFYSFLGCVLESVS